MDPTKTLAEIRRLASEIGSAMKAFDAREAMPTTEELGEVAVNGEGLADLVTHLDRWITSGGFLPHQWVQGFKQRLASTMKDIQ